MTDSHANGLPSIGVVVATYNHARLLSKALESVLPQMAPSDALVVVDDGSTDDTSAVLAPFVARGVQAIRQGNLGASHARNRGMALLTTDFALFLDADDVLSPRGLTSLRAKAAQSPDADVVHGDWSYVCEPYQRRLAMSGAFDRSPLETLVMRNPIALHSAMARRQALIDAGGFETRTLTIEDYALWVHLAANGAVFAHTPVEVAEYHWLPDGKSGSLVGRVSVMRDVMDWVWSRPDLPPKLRKLERVSRASAEVEQCVLYLRAGQRSDAAEALMHAHETWPPILARVDTFFRILHARRLEAVLLGRQEGTDGDGTGASHADLDAMLTALADRGLLRRDVRAAARSADALALRLQGRNREAIRSWMTAAALDPRQLARSSFVRGVIGAWIRS